MTANLELFNSLFEFAKKAIGYDTYDSLPTKQVPYPFIVLDNMEDSQVNLKTDVVGRTAITVHIWGSEEMRGEVTNAVGKLLLTKEIESANYRFQTRYNKNTRQIINDTSVANTKLIHGIATLVFDWFKKQKGN